MSKLAQDRMTHWDEGVPLRGQPGGADEVPDHVTQPGVEPCSDSHDQALFLSFSRVPYLP